ncbi:MAG: metal ABC transporter permease, partial [Bacteroidota bacterium]
MGETFELFQYAVGIRALWASVMVGLMCGVLGCFIVLRNMALIGDALSHAVLPGVVVGFVLAGSGVLAIFSGAVVAGVLTAIFITWIQHKARARNDAAIGIVFTAMFSIGVIGITKVTRGGGVHLDLDHFLFGNVLTLAKDDLYLTAFILVYVLASIIIFYRFFFVTTFQPVIAETMGVSVQLVHYYIMLLLSFAVVVSMRAVGVILVVAMLITPASTALLLTDRLKVMLWISGLLGMIAPAIGLVLSVYFDAPPGPMMVLFSTLFYLIAVVFAPKKGLLFRQIHKVRLGKKIRLEDTLKQSLKLRDRKGLHFSSLKQRLGFPENELKKQLRILRQKGWVLWNRSKIELTNEGLREANRLVRAHRLWETYLVQQMGLTAEQIHEDAEKYEHLLSEELLDEVDHALGFPEFDPHGSPIPKKFRQPIRTLIHLNVGEQARIANDQPSDHLISKLWNLGLLPGTDFKIVNVNEEQWILEV